MDVAATSELLLEWTKRRFPLSTASVPFVLFLTPSNPVSRTTFVGPGACWALLTKTNGPAKSKAVANTIPLTLDFIPAPFLSLSPRWVGQPVAGILGLLRPRSNQQKNRGRYRCRPRSPLSHAGQIPSVFISSPRP